MTPPRLFSSTPAWLARSRTLIQSRACHGLLVLKDRDSQKSPFKQLSRHRRPVLFDQGVVKLNLFGLVCCYDGGLCSGQKHPELRKSLNFRRGSFNDRDLHGMLIRV
jgi:hypothetical protein